MSISPQAQRLYQLLLNSNQPLSAKQLATKLDVYPNTIYRLSQVLLNLGLIEKEAAYPYRFNAKPIDEGLSLFLLHQNEWFIEKFSSSNQPNIHLPSPEIKLSFIKGRDQLMELSVSEINHSHQSIDLLRSGHEIPSDVMLALNHAKKRGVSTRMLIQDYTQENAEQITYWIENGIMVKKTALRYLRLMIYDSKIAYFMSYKHAESTQDMGMKIVYPPFAAILSQLFNQWWQKASSIHDS